MPHERFPTLALALMLLLPAAPAAAQRRTEPGPTLVRLLAPVDAADPRTVAAFWDSAAARGTPFLDPVSGDSLRVLAQFVWRATGIDNVILENGVAGWGYALNKLTHVAGTDIWHMTVDVPADIRLGYMFRENDDLVPWYLEPDQAKRWAANRPDPLNPVVDSAQGRRSVLLGPRAAPDTWSVPHSRVPQGRLEELTFESRALGVTRAFTVYTPPGTSSGGLPLLVIFDGGVYRRVVRVPAILDNLIAADSIRPVVAVFVTQVNRNAELLPNEPFTTFIADELIPFVRRRYALSDDPRSTILLGSSHGGLAADWIALSRPDVIGNVISQSASLGWSPGWTGEPEAPASRAAREPREDVRFWIEAGAFEIDRTRGGAPGQLDVSRHFRDVLVARGYDVAFSVFPGGHEYQSWRITTPAALIHFLGKRTGLPSPSAAPSGAPPFTPSPKWVPPSGGGSPTAPTRRPACPRDAPRAGPGPAARVADPRACR